MSDAPGEDFDPNEWNPSDPDSPKVHYDLGAWSIDQQAEVSATMAEQDVPHYWEGQELVVPEAMEAQVDVLLTELETRLGIERDADAEIPAASAAAPPLLEGEPVVDYDLADWTLGERSRLAEQLVGASIPHTWEGTILIVPAAAEDAVDEVLDSLDFEGVEAVAEADDNDDDNGDNDDGSDVDGDGDADAVDALPVTPEESADVWAALHTAGARLAKDPLDADGLEALVNATESLDVEVSPPGVAASRWREVCGLADELADALAAGDEPDEIAALELAADLRDATQG